MCACSRGAARYARVVRDDGLATCQALLAGIGGRDGDAIGACLAPDVLLRVLTPRTLREEPGREAAVARYGAWLSLESFELLAADAERVADRVRVRYRFRGCDPEKGWQENEHTAYATVDDGLIVALNVSCAGFRPVRPPS